VSGVDDKQFISFLAACMVSSQIDASQLDAIHFFSHLFSPISALLCSGSGWLPEA